ncbi:hypothetical protein JTE90_011832 [Oedothorax gibbosus]|uniref:2-(3-amino-3-carboxypropyl)histidine synthase subunit 2 n=1 Tax=Oedothorax gibbosus TaxID=931172 RepID=A0AAV6VRT1_9ARAC|nr:hypothetical protein JTE90_011832 [Oedothorax gibbosus]
MKPAINTKLDKAVYEWYMNLTTNGHQVTGPAICDKALEIQRALGGSPDFKASNGWLRNFKSRHGLEFSISVNENSLAEGSDIIEPVETILPSTTVISTSSSQKLPSPKKSPRGKRKRVVLSLKDKLDIICRLGNGESLSSLAREYNVGQSSVHDIRVRQNDILEYVSSFANADNMYRRKTMKAAYNKELDHAVYSWYMESIQSGQSINGPMICDKAKEINSMLGGSTDFKGSSGWLQNFKFRHGLLFNDNQEETYAYTDNAFFHEPLLGNSFRDDNKVDGFSLKYEKENSNQSYDSLPVCDVILNEGEVFPNQHFESPSPNQHFESPSPNRHFESSEVIPTSKTEVMQAFDTVVDWAKNERHCTSVDVINLVKLRDLAYAKEMSVAFSSDDSEPISRKIDAPCDDKRDESIPLDDMFEFGKCIEWINSNNFSKVALQFPDGMLNDATSVALKLGDLTGKQMFVLGDTSYGSCCVDEISAEHVSADALIHFGHACLSPTKRLPVLYIFGKQILKIQDVTTAFRNLFPSPDRHIIILYEVMYSYAIDVISEILKEYENLVVSRLEIPSEETKCFTDCEINENLIPITKCHRNILIPSNKCLSDYDVFYIGSRSVTLTNFMLSLKDCTFYSYNPSTQQARKETLDVNKHLKRRYYYIEKAKDAKIIGILVGTLGASNYLSMIQHLKDLIKQAGKKYYTIVVGKLNSAKLANFAEIEIFVNVACVESSLIESREFYQSIVTPYELEIALNKARMWTGDYITDFSEILPGAASYVSPSLCNEIESDVSLVTGKIRHTGLSTSQNFESASSSELVSRSDMTIASHCSQGAEFLAQRSWQGLEQRLGETPICNIEPGQTGIASKYDGEKTD